MRIDEEFKSLIPPLTTEERAGLEASILSEGCRDAIVLWSDVIIDGHNRYEICTEHGIPFKTTTKEFDNRQDVIEWIILNQFGRRNLPAYERARLALRLKPMVEAQAKKTQGTRTDLSQISVKSHDTQRELASIAGVSHDTINKVERIERLASEETKAELSRGEISINEADKRIKETIAKEKRQEAIAEQIKQPRSASFVDIYNTDKKYRVIYADPPWSYNDKLDITNGGGAEKHYPTMPLEDICSIPVPAEKNAVLFLWTTSPQLEDSFKVINAWGFKYKSSFIWDKVGHGMGHYNSVRHEFLLIAVRGSCTPDVKRLYDSVVSIEKTEHSRKPKEFRDMIDSLYPIGNRLEMFAREAQEGWDVWGNMA